jgi:hypothetical protein
VGFGFSASLDPILNAIQNILPVMLDHTVVETEEVNTQLLQIGLTDQILLASLSMTLSVDLNSEH